MNIIWRILGFVVMVAQAWWNRFLVASGRGRLVWAAVPLIGVCLLCGIVQAAGQSVGLIAVAPTGTPRLTATPRPTDASQPTDVPQPTKEPVLTELPAPTEASAPTEATVEPTLANDPAALLPPATTGGPVVTEATAPPAVAPATAVPAAPIAPVAPAGPPTGITATGGRVRDQPTTEGSTPIGNLAAGETVTLRQRTPEGDWYAVETSRGLAGWVSATVLNVDPAVAAGLPTGTTDPAIAIRPTAAPAAPAPVAPAPPAAGNCHPSYPDFCIPPAPPDLSCDDVGRNDFTVLQPDPHRLDGNKDGVGCES